MQLNGKLRRSGKATNNGSQLTTASWPSKEEFVIGALDEYEQPLTSYATRLFHGDNEAAKDAVQHTFMQLCKQSQAEVRPKLARWLYTVCRNRVLDELKSHKRQTRSTPENFEAVDLKAVDPADVLEHKDFLEGIKRLFSCLRDSEREVIELWSFGLSTDEIAGILDKNPGTVRVSLHRAIKRLKQHPQIAIWLERATGQVEFPDVDRLTSTINQNSTPTITGERK